MNSTSPVLGKTLYAILFLVVVPAILMLWARYTENMISYPAVESRPVGIALIGLGTILMLWGMFALKKYGDGLPMNAFPPEKLVSQGPYALIRHPIYVGFGLVLVGVSLHAGSASGLWLIVPITTLCMMALVLGYENIDMKKRFGGRKPSAQLDIAGNDSNSAHLRGKLSASFWVLALLFLGNFLVWHLARDVPPIFGESWRFLPWLNDWRLSIVSLLYITVVPFVLDTNARIRKWVITMLIGLGLSVYIALLWPAAGAQYFAAESASVDNRQSWLSVLLSVPVFTILISLSAYSKQLKGMAAVFLLVAVVLIIHQILNSQSSTVHLIVSFIIFGLSEKHLEIWISVKNTSEKIANSWKEWIFGPIRIINHGFYVGIGAFLGILMAGWLSGEAYAWALLAFALVVIVFSALWAQFIEGSEKLKRPFGYYGALVGIIFASFVVWLMGYNVWVIIGVVSVFMPWVQAIGRLRCLVNGCCHGSRIDNSKIGIRYFHHRSRVCAISDLKGQLLHPTPLYSILWLFLVGFILLALWFNRFPYSFIFGLYLILTGIGRFVEEAYRGEVQTPVWKGLRLYQWTAIVTVIIGMIMTVIPVQIVDVQENIGWQTFAAAMLGGLSTFFAMGVDFPNSNARFSRLV